MSSSAAETSCAIERGVCLPIYKADSLWYVSFGLVRRLRLQMIGPALFDLLETPPPLPSACPPLGGVFSQLVGFLWKNHAFTSFLVSLLLRCRSQPCSKRQGEGELLVCSVGGSGAPVRILGLFLDHVRLLHPNVCTSVLWGSSHEKSKRHSNLTGPSHVSVWIIEIWWQQNGFPFKSLPFVWCFPMTSCLCLAAVISLCLHNDNLPF